MREGKVREKRQREALEMRARGEHTLCKRPHEREGKCLKIR
jgi:hypothetical protein